MASKRDLVEAHTFNRRRLVSAFVSGAPGGREVEPSSPARAVVVGVVLAVLLVGSAALTGFIRPTLASGWEDNTLVIGKDAGTRYLSSQGTLYPVLNMASARLLAPQGELNVVVVPDEQLNERPHGQTLGIIGAPEALPGADVLVQTGWTSCVDQYQRTRLTISAQPNVRRAPARAAFFVRTTHGLSLITDGRRFSIPSASSRETLAALGLSARNPVHVPGRWADLFPLGHDLEPLTVAEAGLPLPRGPQLPSEVRALGTILELPALGDQPRFYVVRRNGLLPLTEVAMQLYRVGADQALREPVQVDNGVLADNKVLESPFDDKVDWPRTVPTPLSDQREQVVCALLDTGVAQQELPAVTLALPRGTLLTGSNVVPGVDDPSVTHEVEVDRGRGALVRAVSGGSNRGTVFLVDATGTAYATESGYVVGQLGYTSVLPPSVPASWMEFLHNGPELSRDAIVHDLEVIQRGGAQ